MRTCVPSALDECAIVVILSVCVRALMRCMRPCNCIAICHQFLLSVFYCDDTRFRYCSTEIHSVNSRALAHTKEKCANTQTKSTHRQSHSYTAIVTNAKTILSIEKFEIVRHLFLLHCSCEHDKRESSTCQSTAHAFNYEFCLFFFTFCVFIVCRRTNTCTQNASPFRRRRRRWRRGRRKLNNEWDFASRSIARLLVFRHCVARAACNERNAPSHCRFFCVSAVHGAKESAENDFRIVRTFFNCANALRQTNNRPIGVMSPKLGYEFPFSFSCWEYLARATRDYIIQGANEQTRKRRSRIGIRQRQDTMRDEQKKTHFRMERIFTERPNTNKKWANRRKIATTKHYIPKWIPFCSAKRTICVRWEDEMKSNRGMHENVCFDNFFFFRSFFDSICRAKTLDTRRFFLTISN